MVKQYRENRRRPRAQNETDDPGKFLIYGNKPAIDALVHFGEAPVDGLKTLIDARKTLTDAGKVAVEVLPQFDKPPVDLFVCALKARQTNFHFLSRHASLSRDPQTHLEGPEQY